MGGLSQGDPETKVRGREGSQKRINNVSQVFSLRSLENCHKTKKERFVTIHGLLWIDGSR